VLRFVPQFHPAPCFVSAHTKNPNPKLYPVTLNPNRGEICMTVVFFGGETGARGGLMSRRGHARLPSIVVASRGRKDASPAPSPGLASPSHRRFTYAARTIDRRATGGEVALLSPNVACSLPSPASHGPSVSTNAVVGTVPNITYMTRISCRRWTRATRCPARILLYTARDAQCDKLAEVVGRTSTVANVVNCRQFVIKRLRQPILDYRA